MTKKLYAFLAFCITIPGASFSNETFYKNITLERLIDKSDVIALVEKSDKPVTSEKVSIGIGYPPFIKTIHHFKVIKVLFKKPGFKTADASAINVVMAHYSADLDIHTKYHKNKLSKSPIYESYQEQSIDSMKDQQFIIFVKQHFIVTGYFEKKIVPVKGMLEWTVENSYEIAAHMESVIKQLKLKVNNKIGDAITDEYSIDDIPVTAEDFAAFLKALREMPNTWFCAETNMGGITGYDAVDTRGVVYHYRTYSESGNNRCTIKRKK